MSASAGRLFGVQTACLLACSKYSKNEKQLEGFLPYSAGFVGDLAGKRVCHGNCGPNPQTAGHLGCLERGVQSENFLDCHAHFRSRWQSDLNI